MKNIRSVVISSAFALALCGMANATVLDLNCSVTTGPTELGTATSGTIQCQDFNTALGTLTGMSLQLSGGVVNPPSVITIQNTSGSSQSGSATTDSGFNLTSSLTGFTFTTSYDPILTINTLFSAFANTGTQTVNSGDTDSFNVSASNSQTQINTGGVNYLPYEFFGYNTFNVSAKTNTGISSTFSGGNVTISQTTSANFTGVVEYTYTPSSTPEPATMALFGSGLIGLGLIRRKIHKKV